MDIFVTGATGVLGRATIPLLRTAGHRVRALSRSDANERRIRAMGVEPVVADLFDADSLRRAMGRCDATLHLATRIPPTSKAGRLASWAENDLIRRDGTRALVRVARDTSVGTLVYPSIAYVYPDSGDRWIDAATTAPATHPVLQSTLDAEATVAQFTEEGGKGVILRLGTLYGPDAPSAHEMLRMARKMGVFAFPGPREAYLPTIWVDDAARALVAALDAPAGVYDGVDDAPLTRGEFAAALAAAVGRERLRTLPPWLMRLLAPAAADMLSRSQRIVNRRFKEAANWAPMVPDAREGLARMGNVATAMASLVAASAAQR
jgi:nucleoside-diphosphate-sugar epimerase